MINAKGQWEDVMGLRWLWMAVFLAAAAGLPFAASGAESSCPRAGTLGVARTVEIDTTGGPGFGMEHYKAYDFLAPKEVVLTFDDGPQKYTTEAVLQALADECVKATFFSIGKMALGYPEIIREVAKAEHTVGTHTWSHKAIAKFKTFDEGKDEIERGISAVHRAVGGPIASFFRFPTLVDTSESVAYLGKRNIAMFSTDIDSFDFKPQTADHLVKSVMQKLEKRGKAIILMHDIHKTTAKAVPMLLAELKAKGYKIVHMTAKAPVTTLAEYDSAIEKEAKGLPQVGSERPMSSVVKTLGGAAPAEENSSATTEPEGMPAPATEIPSGAPAAAESLPAFPSATQATPPAAASPPTPAPATPGKQSTLVTPRAEVNETNTPTGEGSPAAATTTSEPSTPAPSPVTGSIFAPPATTSSVVRTVSGETADAKVEGEAPAKNEGKHEPSKSLSERVKETWELWFGQ
jgi:peptidoglycan/xylan/chitin deacetylase (PgdA/CDA1 family)